MNTLEISLFSGVGMFSYGFQRVNPNHRVGCFVECEAFPQRVLRHHWPDLPIYDDVRDVTYERLKEDGIISDTAVNGRRQGNPHSGGCDARTETGQKHRPSNGGEAVADTTGEGLEKRSRAEVSRSCQKQRPERCGTGEERTIISGGFPCQDLSTAGKQAGIDGERSGLWSEYARIIGELRHLNPIVFIENVPTLFTGGDTPGDWGRRVLRDLAEIFLHGDQPYRVEGHVIPAGDANGRLSAGAPHRRERAWIVAYPMHNGRSSVRVKKDAARDSRGAAQTVIKSARKSTDVAYPDNKRPQGERPDSHQEGRQGQNTGQAGLCNGTDNRTERKPEPELGVLAHGVAARLARHRWLPEPGIGRIATGIPDRAAKLKALGNGLVWPIPAAFMSALMEYYDG